MFKKFYPTKYYESAYSIDFQELYEKGYRGLLTDVDNTLVEHGAPSTEKSETFFRTLRQIGWKTCIISNNHEARVRPFAKACESLYVFDAGKPSRKGYTQGMRLMGTDTDNTLFLGDQIFTDILGANRSGLKSILVKPVKTDHKILILMKRVGETLIKFFYFRYASRHTEEL